MRKRSPKLQFSFQFVSLATLVLLLGSPRVQGSIFVLLFVLLPVGLYVTGLVRLWGGAGIGHGVPIWRAGCFLAGMAILALTLMGPIDELADEVFSVHMAQHMLLINAVAPLLLLGEFSSLILWAVGQGPAHRMAKMWKQSKIVRSLWERATNPLASWTLFAICLWVWHVPAFYQAALENELLHDLEHFLFLAASLLFWWYLVQNKHNQKARYGMVVMYLFTTLLHESALGALLTFSSQAWYSSYTALDLWGLSPLNDQQLAGVIMWLPGSLLFTLLIVLTFGLWLQAIEKAVPTQPPKLAQTGDRNG